MILRNRARLWENPVAAKSYMGTMRNKANHSSNVSSRNTPPRETHVHWK